MIHTKNTKGFTLIEMMLVLVIIGIIVYASLGYMQMKAAQMRIDKTTAQMQQILNAGLAYYVANGKWPNDIPTLQAGYLQGGTIQNPWFQPYALFSGPPTGLPPAAPAGAPPVFYVYTQITGTNAGADALSIAGALPFGFITAMPPTAGTVGNVPSQNPSTCPSGSCFVVSSVNIPGQNLNNARAINFAGVYTHGGCVPVPQCPVDASGSTMTPQIFVVPISVSGVNDIGTPPSTPSTPNLNAYPLTSFTAYALPENTTPTTATPPNCNGSTSYNVGNGTLCNQNNTSSNTTGAYWRVCMQVVTEKGDLSGTGGSGGTPQWGEYAKMAVFTRCGIANEPAGTGFNVYSN